MEQFTTIVMSVLGAITTLLITWWMHRRAVTTAEQMGRAIEIEKHEALKRQADAGATEIISRGEISAVRAEQSVGSEDVTEVEVNKWTH
jgi:hypothetical protein